jgi:hypothetical protein
MTDLILGLTLVLSLFLSIFGFVYLRYRRNKKYPVSEDDLRAYLTEGDMQHEARVRKQWLISYCLFTTMSVLLLSLIWLYAPAKFPEKIFSELEQTRVGFFMYISYILLSSVIGYYFAHRRRGTIWLLLAIVGMGMNALVQLFAQGVVLYVLGWKGLLFCPLVGIEIWAWVNCIRLRKVNALRKFITKLARKHKYFQKEAPIISTEAEAVSSGVPVTVDIGL